MNNTIEIVSDGANVYCTLSVKANIKGKIILGACVIFLVILHITLFSSLTQEELKEFILPLFIFGALIIIFPVRYFIWNLYGKEHLIINTKSVSHRYDYGLVSTSLKTHVYNRLGTGYELVRQINQIEHGRLIFYTYNDENGLQELLFQTSVLINLEELIELDQAIDSLFEQELINRNNFIGYSLN